MGTGGTGAATAAAGSLACPVGANISARADSPSHVIVNSRASVGVDGPADSWPAEIVTGVPACDVLLAWETPAST